MVSQSLDEIRRIFTAGAAVCSTIFFVGVAQLFVAAGYNWAHWGPFGGLTVSSGFAWYAFGMVWSTRDAARDGKRIRWRLCVAATCAVIAAGVLLTSMYFLVKSVVLLAPHSARSGA